MNLVILSVLRLFTVVRFQNVPCIGPSGENGTCYHGKECADLGGQGSTPCAQGLGVCCLCEFSIYLLSILTTPLYNQSCFNL